MLAESSISFVFSLRKKNPAYCAAYVMTYNVIHFLWSAAIGDLSVTSSVDDPLKRNSLIYIISNKYYLLLFFGNPIFLHADMN